jgi:NADH:ubiquinone oxidoreductase subunit 3 (subunit A)
MIFAFGLKWLIDNTPKGWPFILAASIFLALLGVAIIYTGRVQKRILEKLERPDD